MTDYLLDTNHISPLVTERHPTRHKILSNLDVQHRFYIAVPALHEFKFGISLLPRAQQNLKIWASFEPYFSYITIDKLIAEQSAQLRVELRKKGWQLDAVDAMIAVVALQNDLTLLTTDKDFRAIPELRQENWR